ncbi:MAG: hypothetical protein ACON5H_05605 [Akkermansiaceae bacterium]
MSDATTTSEARQGLESTPCSLTAFLALAFIAAGILAAVSVVGLAVWLPIEIERGGKILKERNALFFTANSIY